MKKILMLTALVMLFAVPSMALNIKGSKHNLGTTRNTAYNNYRSSNETQICVFCHTPHNTTKNIPLWNRNNPGGGSFRLYTASPTLNIATADKQNGLSSDSISLFCLSCHDGVTALNSVQNTPNGAINMNSANGKISGKADIGGGRHGSDGLELTNDHPVNFNYDNARTNEGGAASTLNARSGHTVTRPDGAVVTLKFFKSNKAGAGAVDGYLECATCHEVHGAGFAKFLRRNNNSSGLCLTCHKK